eukprot:gene14697-16223_t
MAEECRKWHKDQPDDELNLIAAIDIGVDTETFNALDKGDVGTLEKQRGLARSTAVSDDINAFSNCCPMLNLQSRIATESYCHLYAQKRPVPTCETKDYSPPIIGWSGGDPHIKTLDGFTYTFNGIGDYNLLSLKNSSDFIVHCRMSKAVVNESKNGTLASKATSLLTIQVTSLPSFLNETAGLLGVYNNDMSDDLMTPNGHFLPLNSTQKSIYYEFGNYDEAASQFSSKLTYLVEATGIVAVSNSTSGNFSLQVNSTDFTLKFIVRDERGLATQFIPAIRLCYCLNGSSCNTSVENSLASSSNVYLTYAKCNCKYGLKGSFCQYIDRDYCGMHPCFPGVNCTNNVINEVAECDRCPLGYVGDGEIVMILTNARMQHTIVTKMLRVEMYLEHFSVLVMLALPGMDRHAMTWTNAQAIHKTVMPWPLAQISWLHLTASAMKTLPETGRFAKILTNARMAAIIVTQMQHVWRRTFDLVVSATVVTMVMDHIVKRLTTVPISLDIDECHLRVHDCHENATCTNTHGRFSCTCKYGFTGNGTMCKDVDECRSQTHNCDQRAKCVNMLGGYICNCNDGFMGDGRSCADINECKIATHNCSDNAKCSNVAGGFKCTCRNGFHGDGYACKDVNECEQDLHDCNKNAICINLQGGFNCRCKDGFIRNGSSCE